MDGMSPPSNPTGFRRDTTTTAHGPGSRQSNGSRLRNWSVRVSDPVPSLCHLRRLQFTLSASKLGTTIGALRWSLPLHSSTRRSRNLGTGAGRRSRKCAKSFTRQTLRLSKSGSGGGTPVWSHGGIVCTGETYKNAVKMTFAKGAALKDPAGLFNSSLDGNVRRAIDIHEGDQVDEVLLKDLIRAAVALNLKGKSKPKRR